MSGHFEAKKIAWRQTKDGLVLALSVHPNEMPEEMALSALNTRYMIAFSEIGDDEKPVARLGQAAVATPLSATPPKESANGLDSASTSSSPEGAAHPKKPWSEYKRSQQAAILCADPEFRRYWVNDIDTDLDEEDCIASLKSGLRIQSRKELDTDPLAAKRFDEVVALYHLHRERHK